MSNNFQLDQWFDTTEKIDEVDARLTEAQLVLSAVKRNVDPAGAESHKQYRDMHSAVTRHNRKF